MKKSSFVAMLLGTIGGVLFALGMCMALLPEWHAFTPGIIFGSVGIAFGIATLIVWRVMEHKAPIKFSAKNVLMVCLGVLGVIALGVGMCFCMVWSQMILGVIIGLAGILLLLCLIPLIRGIR